MQSKVYCEITESPYTKAISIILWEPKSKDAKKESYYL